MKRRLFVPVLGLAIAVAAATSSVLADRAGDASRIGVIQAPSFEAVKTEALAWLTKANTAKIAEFETIWDPAASQSLLDRVSQTFALGDEEARELLTEVRDANSSAPVQVPAILKGANRSVFFRANLGLAYAKQLSSKRVHEEAYEVLQTIRAEQVVDPAAYYFFRAVAEHKLIKKQDGLASVHRLLESVPGAPERYLAVAELMKAEMTTWKDEDLGHIARKMSNIERRLDLARGGPKTQKEQEEVIALLDKMIEDLESQC